MKVEMTLEEAIKLSQGFKLCYQSSRLCHNKDKQVRLSYLSLVRKIEEAETALILEREQRLQRLLKQHEE